MPRRPEVALSQADFSVLIRGILRAADDPPEAWQCASKDSAFCVNRARLHEFNPG